MSTSASTTTTVNISMPTKIRDAMRERMADGGYENASEYVRHLIREDLRRKSQAQLEAELAEGENSGDFITVDREYWDRKKEILLQRLRKAKQE